MLLFGVRSLIQCFVLQVGIEAHVNGITRKRSETLERTGFVSGVLSVFNRVMLSLSLLQNLLSTVALLQFRGEMRGIELIASPRLVLTFLSRESTGSDDTLLRDDDRFSWMLDCFLRRIDFNCPGKLNGKCLNSESMYPLGLKQQKPMFIASTCGLMDLSCEQFLAGGWLLKRRGEHGFRRACG